jgi:hypothetical protein
MQLAIIIQPIASIARRVKARAATCPASKQDKNPLIVLLAKVDCDHSHLSHPDPDH